MNSERSRRREGDSTPKEDLEAYLRECVRLAQLPRGERRIARSGLEELADKANAGIEKLSYSSRKEITSSVFADLGLFTRAKAYRMSLAAAIKPSSRSGKEG